MNAVETGRRCPGGRADAARLQWGHGDERRGNDSRGVAHGRRRRRFNGATAMNAVEMPPARACGQAANAVASMGPRRERRGNASSTAARVHRAGCFNGATAMNAVETRSHGSPGSSRTVASMGPRRERRGNARVRAVSERRWTLQWGHGDDAVETSTAQAATAVRVLQWGHGDERRGNRPAGSCSSLSRCRFNGATARTPWKRHDRRCRSDVPMMLQWGHGETPWKPASMPCRQSIGLWLQWGHGGERRGNARGRRRPASPVAARFNGATAGTPWKPTGSATSAERRRRFNGATARTPWKPSAAVDQHGVAGSASMGPRRGRRGNSRDGVRHDGTRLQWGHGGNAVETGVGLRRRQPDQVGFNGATAGTPWKRRRPRQRRATARHASMGPRRERRGNASRIRRRRPEAGFNGATAGTPWKRCRRGRQRSRAGRFNGATAGTPWKRRSPRRLRACRCASMGPRRERRGNTDRAVDGDAMPCFNGATAGTPWKRTRWLQHSPAADGFNGATAGTPWKHLDGGQSDRQSLRFNGATAGTPWKLRCQLASGTSGGASMGPRRERRGNPTVDADVTVRGSCFNGATAGTPWKRAAVDESVAGPHASMGPRRERRGNRGVRLRACSDARRASMGPRRERRGNRAVDDGAPASVGRLQWGHGGNAVETAPTRA